MGKPGKNKEELITYVENIRYFIKFLTGVEGYEGDIDQFDIDIDEGLEKIGFTDDDLNDPNFKLRLREHEINKLL